MSKLSQKLFDFLNTLDVEFSVHRWRSTVKQNARVGGAKKSRHLDGTAVDVSADSIEECEQIAREAIKAGFGGVELDLVVLHVHIDTRETPWHVRKIAGGFLPFSLPVNNPDTTV
jgi:hypothetical protein